MRSHGALLILTSLLLMLGLPTTAEAQVSARPHLHIGVGRILPLQDAGPGLVGVSDRSMQLGVSGGLGITISGSDPVGAEADLLYKRLRLVEEWYTDNPPPDRWKEQRRATYLSLPVTALYRPFKDRSISPFLSAGPFLSVKLAESGTNTTPECGEGDCRESVGPAFDRTTYGLLIGAGVRVEVGGHDIRADVRYARGMADSYVHLFRSVSVHTATVTLGVAL